MSVKLTSAHYWQTYKSGFMFRLCGLKTCLTLQKLQRKGEILATGLHLEFDLQAGKKKVAEVRATHMSH